MRDEGVYYGLSQIPTIPEDKLKTIESFFEEKIQSLRVITEALQSDLQQIRTNLTIAKDKITINIDKIREAESDFNNEPHDFARNLLGFTSYGAILIFNYFVIYNWLKGYTEQPAVTAAGLLIFGGLSLFNKYSLLYNPISRVGQEEGYENESWKIYIEEFSIPFVATCYITYLGIGNKPYLQVFLFWFLIFTILIFSGKAFLNVVIKLIKEYRTITKNKNKEKKRKLLIKNLSADNIKLEEEAQKLSDKFELLNSQTTDANKEIARLLAEKDTNVSLFKSEFELARASRDV